MYESVSLGTSNWLSHAVDSQLSERHGHKRLGHKGAPGGGWGDQARNRRGDIKFMLLGLLAERPQHGYELIKESEHVTALAVKAIGNDLLEPQ
jgi:hypothetical protein